MNEEPTTNAAAVSLDDIWKYLRQIARRSLPDDWETCDAVYKAVVREYASARADFAAVVEALRQAREFVDRFPDSAEIVGKIDAALSRARGPEQ